MGAFPALVILVIVFFLLLLMGLPFPFTLGIINIVGTLVFMGGSDALILVVSSAYDSVASLSFIAVPLFILMGQIILHSGLAHAAISASDSFIGRVPGRLGAVATLAGAIFGAASGSSMASVATIGTVLGPEMHRKGYANWLNIGSISCAGGLAVLIPPSALMVIFAGIASLSMGKLLIAGVIPGLVMALCLMLVIVAIAAFNPSNAPRETTKFNLLKALKSLWGLVPIVGLIVIVIGGIFAGVVTPSEAAALGALGALIITALYRKLTLGVIKKALFDSVGISGMALFIIASSKGFSHILAYTGIARLITRSIVGFAAGDQLTALFIMNIIVFLLGMVMDGICIMLIIIPIFLPIASALGMDLIWWGLVMMVNIEISLLTPPFGMNLFVAKGVLGSLVTMDEIYKGIFPFVLVEVMVLILIIFFPVLATWLPSIMR